MIVGIGLDVVEVTKVRELPAARFAAKEACFKALGTGWSQGVSFLQVEVQRGVAAAAVILEG
jgi:phosphopantetheinyl transferase (holo-ACP synthase)